MTAPRHATPVAHREQRVGRTTWVPEFGAGMVLGALSTLGIIVAMFMSWRSGDVHPSDVPIAFLFDSSTSASDPSILLALIPMAVLLAVGTVLPQANAARVVGALGIIAVVVLFGFQLNNAMDAFPGSNLGDVLDTGFYVAALSGLVGLVSGLMPSGWGQRRWSEEETVVDDRLV